MFKLYVLNNNINLILIQYFTMIYFKIFKQISMKIKNQNHAPMIKQYLSLKSNYPNTLLFYKIGDFYA